MKMILHNLSKNNRNEIAILLFTILFLSACFYFAQPLFETDDDMFMIRILSGQYGTELSSNPIFMSPILGGIIAWLYQQHPSFPWYATVLYTFLLCGLLIGIRIIIIHINDKIRRWTTVFAFLGLFMYVCVRLNFASCSLVLWFMVILYAFMKTLKKNPINYRDYLLALFLLCSYLIRPDIIKVGLIFTLPLIIYFLISELGRKRLTLLVIPLIVVIAFTFVNPDYKTMQPDSYKNLQSLRSKIIDMNNGNINQRTQLALEKSGWSLSDYVLFYNWWTYDESIYDSTKMEEFLKNNRQNPVQAISLVDGLYRIYSTSYFIFPILFSAIVLIKFNGNLPVQKNNKISWGLLIFIALLIYGLACVRFAFRVAVPLYIYFLMLLVILRPSIPIKLRSIKNYKVLIAEVALIILVINCFTIKSFGQQADLINLNKQQHEDTINFIEKINGEDTLFFNFTPLFMNFDGHPFLDLNQSMMYNDIPSGWLIGTDQYYNLLQKYGFTSGRQLIKSSIDNPKAAFYFWQPPIKYYSEYTNYIIEHFEDHYGANGSRFNLDIISDSRYIDSTGNKTGWIYFYIKTAN